METTIQTWCCNGSQQIRSAWIHFVDSTAVLVLASLAPKASSRRTSIESCSGSCSGGAFCLQSVGIMETTIMVYIGVYRGI